MGWGGKWEGEGSGAPTSTLTGRNAETPRQCSSITLGGLWNGLLPFVKDCLKLKRGRHNFQISPDVQRARHPRRPVEGARAVQRKQEHHSLNEGLALPSTQRGKPFVRNKLKYATSSFLFFIYTVLLVNAVATPQLDFAKSYNF